MKTYLLIIVAICLFTTSCKKDTSEPKAPAPVKEILISTDLVSYLNFKQGSYWIYKDSITQQMDTVIAIKSALGFDDERDPESDTIFRYQTGGVVYSHSSSPKKSLCKFPPIHEYISEYNTAGSFIAAPFNSAIVVGIDGVRHITPAEKMVSVGTFSFPKGVETDWIALGAYDNNRGTTFPFTYHKFVLARDVGIIKRSIKNDTLHVVWELVDYKIAQ